MDPSRNTVLIQAAASFAGNLAFPRLAYRLRWPTRLGPRGTLAYVFANAVWASAIQAAFRTRLLPYLERLQAERERVAEELRHELDREPTDEEVMRRLLESDD